MGAQKRIKTRTFRRERAVARVVAPVPTALRAFDPLIRPTGSKAAQLVRTAVMLLAAVALHGFMLTAIFAANRVASTVTPAQKVDEKIKVAIVEPPPPPPPPVEVPEPEPEAVEPEAPEPPPPPPPKKKKPKPPKKKKAPPPPDPIDLPPEPKPPPKKQPRRIVGLNLESTVQGGSGPGFAVGNTRMGQTGDTAEDAKKVEKLQNAPSEPRVNREATRIPGRGRGKVAAPTAKGGRIKPEFPPLLRKQNIEANVTVEVRIDEKGKVMSARVLDGSRFKEFEKSALAAARKQRWNPAKQGNKAIPYTITYTYFFRISN
ncbi:MAG: energy transducer TonB [Myxococcota bacterium]